ncbi:MAG: glycosyltransferase family 39 protein, partial [Chloroflexi bacterium]|nr:glycosyltransferase family 39 protein [Chloroflexota bacterium]
MKRTWLLVAATAGAALALRWYGAWFGWPYVLHPDEPHVVAAAVRFLDLRQFDLNPHFFEYPAFFIYLTAAVLAMGGYLGSLLGAAPPVAALPALYAEQPAPFHVAARLLSGLAGAAAIPLVFLLGRRLYSTATGVLAGALLAVNTLHVRESHYATTDALMTTLGVAASYAAVRVYHGGLVRWYLFAGIFSGLAAATKYPAGVALLSVLLAHALRSRREPETRLLSLPPFLAVFAALDAFLIAAPYTVLDVQAFANALFGEWVAQNIPQLGESTRPLWFYLRAFGYPPILAMAGLALTAAGLMYVLGRRSMSSALLLSFPVFFYFTIGTAVIKVERYFLPMLPFLAIAVAALLVAGLRRRNIVVWSGSAVAAAAVLVLSTAYDVRFVMALASPDPRVQARDWMQDHLPRGSSIVMVAGAYGWQNPPLNSAGFRLLSLYPPYQDVRFYRRLQERQLMTGPFAGAASLLLGKRLIADAPPRPRRQGSLVETWAPPGLEELRRQGAEYFVLTDQLRAWYDA